MTKKINVDVSSLQKLEPMELFYYWIAARFAMQVNRYAGRPFPWSSVALFNLLQLCNVRRIDDRVSQSVVRLILRMVDAEPADVLHAIYLARSFRTQNAIDAFDEHGLFERRNFSSNLLCELVRGADQKMVGTRAYRGFLGVDKTLDALRRITAGNFADRLFRQQTMRAASDMLAELPGLGGDGFNRYQLLQDISYVESVCWSDVDTFAIVGPGTKSGAAK
jgi:hypothetical protein